jgi:hypothetical protein
MTTRKPKPTYSPLIEWPTEELPLVAVIVDEKEPVRAAESGPVETELPVERSLLQRGKITLH